MPTVLETIVEICNNVETIVCDHVKKAQNLASNQYIVEEVLEKVKRHEQAANFWVVMDVSHTQNGTEFKVKHALDRRLGEFRVDFRTQNCTCNAWFPCEHAYAAAVNSRMAPSLFYARAFLPMFRSENLKQGVLPQYRTPNIMMLRTSTQVLPPGGIPVQAKKLVGRRQRRI